MFAIFTRLHVLKSVLSMATMDIINSGLETEQPIRVHFYYLTWWTWCLLPSLHFPDTRSSREIRYGDFFGYLKTKFYSCGPKIVSTMSMEFQSPDTTSSSSNLTYMDIVQLNISSLMTPGFMQQKKT